MAMSQLKERRTYFFLLFATLACYLLLPVFYPLLGYYDRIPLRDIRSFAPSAAGGLVYAVLFLVLYAAYTGAWRDATSRGAKRWQIFIPAILFCLPLLLTYPINATDIFRYFIRGRVTAFYGDSALATPPSAFPGDPYLPLAGEWADETSPYGPLWELVAAAVPLVTWHNLLASLLLFKIVAIASHLGTGFVIWRAMGSMAHHRQASMTLLWVWNPALLFMFAMDGHNDALMIFWLALGYLLMQRRPLTGFFFAALGALTKPIGLLALPFLLLAHWRVLRTWAARLRYLLAAGGGSLLIALIAFAPFGSSLELAFRLLTEASEAVGFSLGILLVLLGQRLHLLTEVDAAVEIGAAASLVLFAMVALVLLWPVWRGLHHSLGIAAVFAAYVLTAFTFRIWYSTWPFVWLILAPGARRSRAAGFWFLLTAHLSLLIYGHMRVIAFSRDHFLAHLFGVPFTFVLPLLLALWLPLTSMDKADLAHRSTPVQ